MQWPAHPSRAALRIELICQDERIGVGFDDRSKHGTPPVDLLDPGEVELSDAPGGVSAALHAILQAGNRRFVQLEGRPLVDCRPLLVPQCGRRPVGCCSQAEGGEGQKVAPGRLARGHEGTPDWAAATALAVLIIPEEADPASSFRPGLGCPQPVEPVHDNVE